MYPKTNAAHIQTAASDNHPLNNPKNPFLSILFLTP